MGKKAHIFILFIFIMALTACGNDPVISFETTIEDCTVTSLSSTEDEGVVGIYVAVNGAVHNPGVYIMPEGSRICDALNAAGGLTGEADVSNLNLVNIMSDGTSIYVRSLSGDGSGKNQQFQDSKVVSGDSGLVNINSASLSELTKLPGIGEAKAKAIIAYREVNGSFEDISDLKKVSGIKDGTFEKIKDSITAY